MLYNSSFARLNSLPNSHFVILSNKLSKTLILDCPLSVSCPCAYFPPSFILAYIFIYPPFSRFSLKYIKSYKRAFITRPIFKFDFLENRNLDRKFYPYYTP